MNMPLSIVLELLDLNFDYLLAIDGEERVIFLSNMLGKRCSIPLEDVVGQKMDECFPESALEKFHRVMPKVKESRRSDRIFLVCPDGRTTALKAMHKEWEDGEFYIFLGMQLPMLDHGGKGADHDDMERAKELACIYNVSTWVENSSTILEFFERLPDHLNLGLQYPGLAVIYSRFREHGFGRRPKGNSIRSEFLVEDKVAGEIVIGYDQEQFGMIVEEQKMLDEITRMLGWALDRKELISSLADKRQQQEDLSKQLDTVNSYLERSNQGLEESKLHLETMFKAIPDVVAIIDRGRNVIMTNREDVILGDKCHKTFFDNERPCADCRLKRIIKDKTPLNMEIQHDDSYFEVHALPIFDKDGEVDGIIEFYRDITYQKTYEQQLQQADKLASLGQLVSGIGHEINNPNQFIRGNVKIIQQAMDDILPIVDEYAKEHPDFKVARLKYDFFRSHIETLISDMANGSERIKRIVEDLKRFARKDEGLLNDSLDVNTIIQESVRLTHNQVHKYADIELDLDPDLPEIKGNAQKIEQVLINLVINASQAMQEDVRGVIELSTRLGPDSVTIEVEDDGKGMSDGTLASIFDPFFTTKRARGGTGLGLSIAYKIMQEHGGSISAASELGEGTTFTITLPLPKKTQALKEA